MSGRPHGFVARVLGRLLSWLLEILRATWRVDVEGREHLDIMLTRGEPFLLTFWHGKYVPLLVLFRGLSACIFSSQSARGDIIAEMCRHFGYECVQIPDHGGDRSLVLMRNALSTRQAGAVALDGPLGPRHVVHRGAVQLASQLGFSLLPASVGSRRRWVQSGRWDELEFPAPLTRLCLVIGDPLKVPAILSKAHAALWAGQLGDALEAVDQRAERRAQGSAFEQP